MQTRRYWDKVRLLHDKWANKTIWIISSKFYYGLLIIGAFILIYRGVFERLTWYEGLSLVAIAISLAKVAHREGHKQGYVDAWNETSEAAPVSEAHLDNLLKDD